MKLFLICVVCFGSLGCLLISESLFAESRLKDDIRNVLSQNDAISRVEWWKSLSPDAPAILMSIYAESHDIHEKTKVLEALRFYSDAKTTQFLKNQALTASNNFLKRTSIRSISFSQGPKEFNFISSFLKHPDPHVRLEAAKSLVLMHNARAETTVREYLKTEKAPWIIKAVRRD